jgi:hypothetical protein
MKSVVAILFLSIFSLNVQASIGCTLKDIALSKVVPAVNVGLECNNEQAIRNDIEAIFDKYNICSENIISYEDKGLWALICKKYLPSLVDYSVDYVIPDKWECKATNLKKIVTEIIITQCDRL